jgi:[calcium/calmodulin-dependent protein kinase] kinase
MKAVKKFKRLMDPTKPQTPMQSILGGDHEAYFVEPPMEMDPDEPFPTIGEAHGHGHGLGTGIRKVFGRHPFAGFRENYNTMGSSDSASISSRPDHSPSGSQRPSGVFEIERKDSSSRTGRSPGKTDTQRAANSQSASPHIPSRASSATTKRSLEGTRGHARDPLEEEFPYLFIGPSTYTGTSHTEPNTDITATSDAPIFEEPESTLDPTSSMELEEEPVQIVSESPGAADFNIYETAYRLELDRIKHSLSESDRARQSGPKVYLTRRVENKDEVMRLAKEKALDLQIGQRFAYTPAKSAPSAFSSVASALRAQMQKKRAGGEEEGRGGGDGHGNEGDGEGQGDGAQGSHSASHPHPAKRLSLSSQIVPDTEASSLEAAGVSARDGTEDSKAQLRRLLGRVRGKDVE